MSDWEEIKRLQADLQRTIESSTSQRLSERNCVEIVQKLVGLGLIDVIYTLDGREYLTHQELNKEIKEELIARGGRVNLVDLQASLNVDLSHVESKVNEIVKHDRSLTLILGQLIDQCYLETLAEEINDKLQEQGQVTLAELARTYDLPGDFISQIISTHLGTVIKGQIDDFDRNLLFTNAFIHRNQAIMRGAFSAITRPVSLISVMSKYDLNERLFYSILEELVGRGELAGMVAGGRQERAQYIPDIYTKAQNEWVDNFLKQNGYLDYDSVGRLGISDPKNYIKKRYKNDDIQYLESCCIARHLQEQLEAEIDEALADGGWVDIMPSMPSICTENDASQLLSSLLRNKTGVMVFCDSILASDTLISTCQKPFNKIINEKAEMVARTNPGLLTHDTDKRGGGHLPDEAANNKEERKEQRRKKASVGKSGGGTQGREVKTKSTKKKFHRGRDHDDSDDDTAGHSGGRHADQEFITMVDIEETLRAMEILQECPDELVTGIAVKLHRPLNKQFIETAKSIFIQSTGGATMKKSHGELSEKVHSLWMNIKLFEKGIKSFNEDTQGHLIKHTLKTICTDLTNIIITGVAGDHMVSLKEDSLSTTEARAKVLAKINDDHAKAVLVKLNGSLNGKSLEDFLAQLDQACGPELLGVILRKVDKKKERQVVFHHRQALMEQLRQETDPALALHLAAVLLFQAITTTMLHAPGRCVPQIIALLKQNLDPEHHTLLVQCQDLVVQQLRLQNEKSQDESTEDAAHISRQLEELLPKIKDIALTTKKSFSAKAVED